jgi:uncharacterized Zn finger protein
MWRSGCRRTARGTAPDSILQEPAGAPMRSDLLDRVLRLFAREVSAREDGQAKGTRYVLEGRVQIYRVDDHVVRATVRGQGEIGRLGFDEGDGWWCNCPARSRCAHHVALQLVVVAPWSEAREAHA